PDVYETRALASTWVSTGDPKLTRTIELQRQALAKCLPDEKDLRADMTVELANYLLVAHDLQGAEAAYEQALKDQPNNATSLNNLAFLLAEDLNDPNRALPYAEQA